jgi:pimeloyl-ACP methyl ester carboxylesterase
MGAAAAAWRPTFRALAAQASVIAYDRAGLGASDPDAQPRTLDRLTDDLEDLLEALALPPAVLVGHSYGGLIVRHLAARRPDLVRAVALVDPTDERASFYSSPGIRIANAAAYRLMYLLARAGLLHRLQARGGGGRLISMATIDLPSQQQDAYLRDFFAPSAMRAAIREMDQLQGALRELQAAPRTLPVPVTVISAGRTSKRGAQMREEVQRLHAEFASSSPNGRHVVASDSGHYVPIEAVDMLTAEILHHVSTDAAPPAVPAP